SDRRQVAQRVVGQPGIQRRVHGEADVVDENGVAVRRRLRHGLRSYGAPGAAAVIDDDLLAQVFAQTLRQQAPDDVVAAAGGERDDQTYRLRGIDRLCCR